MIKIVAEMSAENSTKEIDESPIILVKDASAINALPLTAILLAIVASCNSGMSQ